MRKRIRFSFLLMAMCLLTCSASEKCRSLTLLDEIEGKSLRRHLVKSFATENCDLCWIECFLEEECVSYNCGNKTCDLNSSDHVLHPNDLVQDQEKFYRATQNACQEKKCPSNSNCLNGFTDKGYMCKCSPGFTGDNCEQAAPAVARKTCAELYADGHREDKAYELDLDSGKVPVYCHMSDIMGCGSGGFSLVMKMDGSRQTFLYDSALWTNTHAHNPNAGTTGFDTEEETKLPTYWETPFTKLCLAMKVGEETKFISLNKTAASLHSLIADDQYRATSLGLDAWKSLLSNPSLQANCNREGFNAKANKASHSKARIGITSNDQEDCNSNNSRIGFGTGGYPHQNISCGNAAIRAGYNGDRDIKAFCYILVQ